MSFNDELMLSLLDAKQKKMLSEKLFEKIYKEVESFDVSEQVCDALHNNLDFDYLFEYIDVDSAQKKVAEIMEAKIMAIVKGFE